MTTHILLYLVKANLILAVVWLFCRLLLGSDTRFRRKRMIINCGMTLAIILPLLPALSWGVEGAHSEAYTPGITLPAFTLPINIVDEPMADSPTTSTPMTIALMSYVAVAGMLLLRFLFRLLSVASLHRKCLKDSLAGTTIYRIAGSTSGPFSFFGKIYAGEHTLLSPDMLRHEKAHVGQLHSLDIIAGELLSALLWANPAAWLLRKEMRDNLEYLADEASVEPANRQAYQLSLLHSCSTLSGASLCTNFNVSSIKKRIKMINRISTTSRGRWIYLLATPLLLMAIAVGCASPTSENTQSQAEAVETTACAENQEASAPAVADPETTETAISEEDTPTFGDSEWELYDFLGKNLIYPQSAIDDSIEGTVIIAFVIAPDGSVTNPTVKQGVRQDLDEAALNAVKKMPKWNPAPSGKESKEISLPIKFLQQPITKPASTSR